MVLMVCCIQPAHAERQTTYFHTDGLGSVVAASDENGVLLWRKGYAPYGEQLNSTTENEKLSYTGKEHDDVTGLTYFGVRYYDPELGRFMSIDPLGFVESNPMSFNRFGYANNNPYRFIDPDGREPGDAAFGLAVGLFMPPEQARRIQEAERAIGNVHVVNAIDGGAALAEVGTALHSEQSIKAAVTSAAIILIKKGKGRGRNGSQFRGPDPEAQGPHSRFRTDSRGVTAYETYDFPEPGKGKRVDVVGPPHNGVPTPHVVDTQRHVNPSDPAKSRYTEGPTRPATADEVPRRRE